MMTTPIIEIQNITKRFDQKDVLNGVDLTIEQGQVVGLLGTNGSGKTTLIKCLLGLLKTTSGTCSIFGEDAWDLSAQAKSRLGYVSQEFAVLPWLTVQAATEYIGAFYEHWDHQLVSRLLAEWDLDIKQRVGVLSVGQRQKLAVILAMGHRPELLILDEPVASLDPLARRRFLQSLIDFTEDEKHTILFSTHITSDLERIASHVGMLREGEMGYWGEMDSLKNQVKRLRIHAKEFLPATMNIPGTIRCHVDGEHALVTVSEMDSETVNNISTRLEAKVSVEDLNLEEIFLELSGISSEYETAGASR